jgi:hypothetical protein
MQDLVEVITGRSNARGGDTMFDSDQDGIEDGDEESGDDSDEDSDSDESGAHSDEEEAQAGAAELAEVARIGTQVSRKHEGICRQQVTLPYLMYSPAPLHKK